MSMYVHHTVHQTSARYRRSQTYKHYVRLKTHVPYSHIPNLNARRSNRIIRQHMQVAMHLGSTAWVTLACIQSTVLLFNTGGLLIKVTATT